MKNYTLITGCTSGIGKSLAYVFARNNHHLILVSRNINKLNELKEELLSNFNVDIKVLSIDLSETDSALKIYDYTVNNNLNVEIIINNAGSGIYGEFLDNDLNKVHNMLNLNINTLVDMCHYYGNYFKNKKEGTIINIASTGAFVPGPYMAGYYASKAFVLSLSEALSMELKKYNINVCCVCPGPTKTEFFDKSCEGKYDLLKNVKAMNSDEVARIIYKSFLKKKVVTIPGFKNKLGVFGIRFISRRLTRKILYNIQSKRFK